MGLLKRTWRRLAFPGSARYWERRYRRGKTSGAGSAGTVARFKASVLNDFVEKHGIRSVLELGCGDGQQLALARYPRYLGLDVSAAAIDRCLERFASDPSKSFLLYDPERFRDPAGLIRADLAISLEVIFHLTEDAVYERYLAHLFAAAERFVIVFSSNRDEPGPRPHVRHRRFTDWVEARRPDWTLAETIPNPHGDESFAEFFVFERGG